MRRRHLATLVTAGLLFIIGPVLAHDTHTDSYARLGGSQEFARRRGALMTALKYRVCAALREAHGA